MAESATIIQACVSQWNASTALQSYTIRTTRIPQGQAPQGQPQGSIFPYCYLKNSVVKHMFSSANYRVTWYRSVFTVYVGMQKSLLNTISNALATLFDRNIGLPVSAGGDGCYVLAVQADEEQPDTADDDYYGEDVNVLAQSYKMCLSEIIPAVNSTLA